MISIKIKVNKENYIEIIEIKGHAPKKGEISIECSIVSTLTELLNLTFNEIYKIYKINIKSNSGYFLMKIHENEKEKRDFIEKFLAPFIKMFYEISNKFNYIQFEIKYP